MKQFIRHEDVKIELNVFGTAPKTLIFLAGWTHDFQYEPPLIRLLQKKFRVVTISYPGYAKSQESTRAESMRFLSTIIDSVVASLNIRDYTLVGFSMGCQVAVDYLKRHPSARAVLISPVMHPLIEDTPWYGKLLLSSSMFINAIRVLPGIKRMLVEKAYSMIGGVTEGKKNTSGFTDSRLSVTGAYDTLIAALTSFTDPLFFKDRIRFIFGDEEVLQRKHDMMNIRYEVIHHAGHGAFETEYKQIAARIMKLC